MSDPAATSYGLRQVVRPATRGRHDPHHTALSRRRRGALPGAGPPPACRHTAAPLAGKPRGPGQLRRRSAAVAGRGTVADVHRAAQAAQRRSGERVRDVRLRRRILAEARSRTPVPGERPGPDGGTGSWTPLEDRPPAAAMDAKTPAMSRSAAGDAWSSSPAPKTPSIPTTWSSSAPAARGLSASREKRVPWHRSSRPGRTCRRGLFPAYVRGRRAGLMGARPMPARRSDRSGAAARALLPTTHRAGRCSGADLLAVLTPTSDSGPVSGQRKRRRRPEAERLRLTARTAPDSGRWEVIFETQDVVALRTQLRRLREARVDESMVRVDTLCGRLELPTVYRLSRFVTNPTSA